MPSHLHPRSRYTTSLFGTTLLVSFIVVGIPHIIPCPAPRVDFADAAGSERMEGRRRRRRRVPVDSEEKSEDLNELHNLRMEERLLVKKSHECPVPKPRTLLEGILGIRAVEEKKELEVVKAVERREPVRIIEEKKDDR